LNGKSIWHEKTTLVPPAWDGAIVKEYADYKNYLSALEKIIATHKAKGVPIYFKGFGTTHAYDRELLKANFKKYRTSAEFFRHNEECL